jgi:hypothetical protein
VLFVNLCFFFARRILFICLIKFIYVFFQFNEYERKCESLFERISLMVPIVFLYLYVVRLIIYKGIFMCIKFLVKCYLECLIDLG